MSKSIKREFIETTKKFKEEINEIQRIRRMNIDKSLPREIGTHRILDKIPEFPEWPEIRKRLILEPRKEDMGL